MSSLLHLTPLPLNLPPPHTRRPFSSQVVYEIHRPVLKRLFMMTRPLPEDGELEEGEEVVGTGGG